MRLLKWNGVASLIQRRAESGGCPRILLFSHIIQSNLSCACSSLLVGSKRSTDHAQISKIPLLYLPILPGLSSGKLSNAMTAITQPTAESQPAYLLHNPSIFSLPHSPYPGNSHPSATLDEQQETERVISELLLTTAPPALPGASGKTLFNAGSSGAAGAGGTAGDQNGTVLRKTEHLQFFQSLFFKMPPPYVSLDASRPWLMYWTVHSWDLLGIALDQATKDRYVYPTLCYQTCLTPGLPQVD